MTSLYFKTPASMNDYTSRVSCRNQEEFYLDKLEKIFSGYPHLGVPREPTKIMKGSPCVLISITLPIVKTWFLKQAHA